MKCKICGKESILITQTSTTRPDFRKEYNIYECPACGFVFSNMLDNATEEDYELFYRYPNYLLYDPIAYREYHENFLNRSNLLFSLVQRFISTTGRKSPKVLVYGNGLSKAVKLLMNSGIEAYSYMSKTTYGTELTDLTKYKNFFDLVVSTEVAEHFVQPLDEFKLIKSVLNTGGWVICSTNSKDRVAKNYVGNLYKSMEYMLNDVCKNAGHTSFYSNKAVDVLAEKLGMSNKSFDVGDNKIGLTLVRK